MRKILFWSHLVLGSAAGVVIFIMSVTGVVLAYERQILAWADRNVRQVAPSTAQPLDPETLLNQFVAAGNPTPSAITKRAQPHSALEVSLGRERTLYLNPYTGAVVGESSSGWRQFFGTAENLHRWLGASLANRQFGRAFTGACNLAFLGLVVSGIYLWMPRKWSWQHVRPSLLFRHGVSGRSRDWNWHNVIGIWSAIPLFFIVLSGVVMSYPWANNLLYRATGNTPPAPVRRGEAPGASPAAKPHRQRSNAANARNGDSPGFRRRPGGDRSPALGSFTGTAKLWQTAEAQTPGWRSITLRPGPGATDPLTFTIDLGNGGQPNLRSQLTLDRATGTTVRWEPFSSYNLGRRLRTWGRFVHTGEAGGMVGQTIAAMASAGGGFLVWTGISLALRRLRARLRRRPAVLSELTTA